MTHIFFKLKIYIFICQCFMISLSSSFPDSSMTFPHFFFSILSTSFYCLSSSIMFWISCFLFLKVDRTSSCKSSSLSTEAYISLVKHESVRQISGGDPIIASYRLILITENRTWLLFLMVEKFRKKNKINLYFVFVFYKIHIIVKEKKRFKK